MFINYVMLRGEGGCLPLCINAYGGDGGDQKYSKIELHNLWMASQTIQPIFFSVNILLNFVPQNLAFPEMPYYSVGLKFNQFEQVYAHS
jgi:hypothetical protein